MNWPQPCSISIPGFIPTSAPRHDGPDRPAALSRRRGLSVTTCRSSNPLARTVSPEWWTRHQIGMLDAISSERLDGFRQNPQ